MTNELQKSLDGAKLVRLIEAPASYVKQRLQVLATTSSYAGLAQAQVDVLTEALLRTTALLYEKDSDGVLANVDRYTFKILRPVPWGSNGWKLWGVKALEAKVLRAILLDRSPRTVPREALYLYIKEEQRWHLNVEQYQNYEQALQFLGLKQETITLAKWRDYAGVVKQVNLDRVNKGRKKK